MDRELVGGMHRRELYEFYWPVPKTGFEWTKSIAWPRGRLLPEPQDEGDYLIERAIPGQSRTVQRYSPFRISGLFRTFADTERSKEGIVHFADQYGFLFEPVAAMSVVGSDTHVRPGEPMEAWVKEIALLRSAVDLWGACREIEPPMRDNSTPIEPTWGALQQMVNEHLKTQAADPKLLWDVRATKACLRMRFMPRSLLAAMWIQLATAIEGDRDYGQCEQCGSWFEIVAEKRKDAKFCSDKCRFKAYRHRQKQARDLSGKGQSLETIAAALGSDVRTIRGWVIEK